MRLTGFRVQMYKSIIDSGWVTVDALSVLVGKNESGKTSLLRALHKLHPFREEPYVMATEWPRGRRKDQNLSHVVCTARFLLTDQECAYLASLTPEQMSVETVEIGRTYAGELIVSLPEDVFPNSLDPRAVNKALQDIPRPDPECGESYQERTAHLTNEVQHLANNGDAEGLAELAELYESKIREALTPDKSSPQFQLEDQHLTRYITAVEELAEVVGEMITVQQQASNYVLENLPTFIYMDDYRAFTGSAELDLVQERLKRNGQTDEDKTLITILDLAGLDLDEEVENGESPDPTMRVQRQYGLDDASSSLTREIANRWKQRRYEVQLRADGQHFYTFVKDEHDESLILLEERSKGFQWFFSFDLMFMHETKGTFENAVILLDEPGLHLHPEAQRDLLSRLEDYANTNTLIYSTHLPFMIDLKYPQRIRVVTESDTGTMVTDDLTASHPEAKLVLQSALGMSGAMHWLVAHKNLVVEGVDDYWFISELSRLLIRSDEDGLADDLMITPAGGASEAVYMATFMIGQGLDVVALFDSDAAGDSAREKLTKNWLTKYNTARATVLSLGDCIEAPGRPCTIENLFDEKFYVEKVQETYAKQLIAAGVKKLALPKGSDPLLNRVERAMSTHNLPFNKGSVAKRIRTALGRMKGTNELSPETFERARKLISAINEAIPS